MRAIIDCDPGVDDALAILLALSSADTEVLAYTPQFGNTSLENAYNNVLKIYGVLDRHISHDGPGEEQERFPALKNQRRPLLIRGAEGPIAGPSHSAAYFHGKDGLGDITSRHGDAIPLPSKDSLSHLLDIKPDDKPGYEHILDLLQTQEDGSVTWIILGPSTNCALALQKNAELVKQKVGMVVIMGGNLDVPGNTSPVAEFNVWADAHAAHAVFEHSATLPIYLVPLDITTSHAMPWEAYGERVDEALHHAEFDVQARTNGSNISNGDSGAAENPHVSTFTTSFLRHTREVMRAFGKDCMELHDPAAVWFAMHNLPGKPLAQSWRTEKRQFVVERHGEYTRGMCVVDNRGKGKKSSTSGSDYGKARAELLKQAEQEDPAPVQVDDPKQGELGKNGEEQPQRGVNVVVETPGSDALVEQMFAGIWAA